MVWLVLFLILGTSKPFSSICTQEVHIIDSLHQQLNLAKEDSSHVLLLSELAFYLTALDSSNAYVYLAKLLAFSKALPEKQNTNLARIMLFT